MSSLNFGTSRELGLNVGIITQSNRPFSDLTRIRDPEGT